MEPTLYELLDVQPGATQEEIKAAWRHLTRQVHPDTGGNAALFRQVQAAFDTLSDPVRRAAYDDALRDGARRTDTEEPPEPHFDPEPDPEWVVVDDSSGEAPFEAGWHEVDEPGATVGRFDHYRSPRLVGAACGVLVACAWIWEASFILGPTWPSDLAILAILGACVGALAAPALLRRRGTAGSFLFAGLMTVAPVLLAVVLAGGLLAAVFSGDKARSAK